MIFNFILLFFFCGGNGLSYVVPNLYDFSSSVDTHKKYLEECQKPKKLNKKYFMSHTRKKVIQVWNNMRVNNDNRLLLKMGLYSVYMKYTHI